MPKLIDLPLELLSHIASFLPFAQCLHHLALTCRALSVFVKEEGWKVFLLNQYPCVPVSNHWRDAARSLTTTRRNWDRRALLARLLEPFGIIYSVPSGRRIPQWTKLRGQTMGYVPVIDSFEEQIGNAWDDKRQTLAWGAGAELVVRFKDMGASVRTDEPAMNVPIEEQRDHYCHRNIWISHRLRRGKEGADDITALSLLKPDHSVGTSYKSAADIIYGTAGGALNLLNITQDRRERWMSRTRTTYATGGLSVGSLDVFQSKNPLLAACLAHHTIALYNINSGERHVSAVSEIVCTGTQKSVARCWATRFLSNESLAVGGSAASVSLQVYGLMPAGFSPGPVRNFGSNDEHPVVLCIVPMPAVHNGSEVGTLFLSGGADGAVR